MSARSPFRSHLLQQWTNSRRSPIVVQQWLKQAAVDEEEEGRSPSAPGRASRRQQEQSRRSMHHSPRQNYPDLSSVDTLSSQSIALAATSWAASTKPKDKNKVNRIDNELCFDGLSAVVALNDGSGQKFESNLETIMQGKQREDFQKIMPIHSTSRRQESFRDTATPQLVKPGMPRAPPMQKTEDQDIASDWPALMENSQKDEDKKMRKLRMAIDQAVKIAKNQQLREGGKKFSFRRLVSSSRSGQRLLDICFQVTLRTTRDGSMAKNEREAWSEVPAFLVAIVHNNQIEMKKEDGDPYKVLDFSPPIKEGQLADYGSACAAVQSVIHSLSRDGIDTKWVTSSVIRTPAFRSLIKAKSTDRVAALVMVHGQI